MAHKYVQIGVWILSEFVGADAYIGPNALPSPSRCASIGPYKSYRKLPQERYRARQ